MIDESDVFLSDIAAKESKVGLVVHMTVQVCVLAHSSILILFLWEHNLCYINRAKLLSGSLVVIYITTINIR